MTRALLAAQSGWGKSWLCQWWTEDNLSKFDALVVLDYKDEYRGLAKAGFASWAGVGEREASLDAEDWLAFIEDNPRVVLARAVPSETWRETAGAVARAARAYDGEVLVVIDEAHFVARQRGSYPEAVKGLATTGRGEEVATEWVTQRLSEIDETVVAQCDVRLLGGFSSDQDLSKIGGVVDYPREVHNPQASRIRGPDAIGDTPVQKHTEGRELVGSDWIYSTSGGDLRRIDSRDLSMDSTHYGADGTSLSVPG